MFPLLVLLLAAPAPAPAPPALSPGNVALLVERVSEQDARQAIAGALRHEDPRVRAAAARVAFVGALALGPQLFDALRNESSPIAAREQLRAVLPATDPALHRDILREASRVGLAADAVQAIARLRGAAVIPMAIDLPAESGVLAAALESLGELSADDVSRLGKLALERGDAVAWTAVLRRGAPAEMVLGSVSHASTAVRAATYAALLVSKEPLAEPLGAALRGRSETPGPGGGTEAAYLHELLLRRLDSGRQRDASWASRLDGLDHVQVVPIPRGVDEMTAAERKTLGYGEWSPGASGIPPSPGPVRMRLLSGLPEGLLADLMAAAGCKPPKQRTMAIAEIDYDVTSRPMSSRVAAIGGAPECQRAMRAALALDTDRKPGSRPVREAVVARLDQDVPACGVEAKKGPAPRPQRVGGRIQEPKKVKNVPPVYPSAALGSRTQGTVILEALIDPRGCVEDLQVLRSINVHLDFEALAAVSAWRYTPTLIDGVAVPVIMTVTVNFKIN